MNNFFDLKDPKIGWIYKRSTSFSNDCLQNIFTIVLIGVFNKGKTFIANMISGRDLKSGVELSTKGLSLIVDEKSGKVFIDSAGVNVPIAFCKISNANDNFKKEMIHDRNALDWFQLNFILNYSHAITMVVGVLTVQEQSLIDILSKNKPNITKIIIHNLFQLKTKEAVRSNYFRYSLFV